MSIVETLFSFPSESKVSFLSLFLYIQYHIGRSNKTGKSLNAGIQGMKGLDALFELPIKKVAV